MKKDNLIYIEHIKDCVQKIKQYTNEMGQEEFINNTLTQDAVIRNLEVIGEATKNLSPEFRNKYPNIPWRNIAGMRDKLIHDYIGVDLWAVWAVVTDILPDFSNQIDYIINEARD